MVRTQRLESLLSVLATAHLHCAQRACWGKHVLGCVTQEHTQCWHTVSTHFNTKFWNFWKFTTSLTFDLYDPKSIVHIYTTTRTLCKIFRPIHTVVSAFACPQDLHQFPFFLATIRHSLNHSHLARFARSAWVISVAPPMIQYFPGLPIGRSRVVIYFPRWMR